MDTYLAPYFEHHAPFGSYDAVNVFTYKRGQSSTALGGDEVDQGGTPHDGDSITWYMNLAAGTYQLTTLYKKASNRCIFDIYIDSTNVGTVDSYAAGTSNNNVSTITGITIAADGNYSLKYVVNGKNASATNYFLTLNWFSMLRTGA